MKLTKIKTRDSSERIESGPIQFDDDWPGVFFRGDEAHYLGFQLEFLFKLITEENFTQAKDYLKGPFNNLKNLPQNLMSCHIDNFREKT